MLVFTPSKNTMAGCHPLGTIDLAGVCPIFSHIILSLWSYNAKSWAMVKTYGLEYLVAATEKMQLVPFLSLVAAIELSLNE